MKCFLTLKHKGTLPAQTSNFQKKVAFPSDSFLWRVPRVPPGTGRPLFDDSQSGLTIELTFAAGNGVPRVQDTPPEFPSAKLSSFQRRGGLFDNVMFFFCIVPHGGCMACRAPPRNSWCSFVICLRCHIGNNITTNN